MNKTSVGVPENVAGLLCYALGWVSGFIIILLEKENKFVRFHALQSIVVFGALNVLWVVIFWIPFIGSFFIGVIWVVALILWVALMVKALQGVIYKLPWAGNIAEKWVG